jgi:hypothetical protein
MFANTFARHRLSTKAFHQGYIDVFIGFREGPRKSANTLPTIDVCQHLARRRLFTKASFREGPQKYQHCASKGAGVGAGGSCCR